MNVALELAERAVFLEKGEVRFSGRTGRPARPPRHPALRLHRRRRLGGGHGGDARRRADRPARARQRLLGARHGRPGQADPALGRGARRSWSATACARRFGGITAIEDISLTLRDGEILGPHRPQRRRQDDLLRLRVGVPAARRRPDPARRRRHRHLAGPHARRGRAGAHVPRGPAVPVADGGRDDRGGPGAPPAVARHGGGGAAPAGVARLGGGRGREGRAARRDDGAGRLPGEAGRRAVHRAPAASSSWPACWPRSRASCCSTSRPAAWPSARPRPWGRC